MTTRDIAAYLGVKPSTVTAYVACGQFPAPDAVVGRQALETVSSQRGRVHVVRGEGARPGSGHDLGEAYLILLKLALTR